MKLQTTTILLRSLGHKSNTHTRSNTNNSHKHMQTLQRNQQHQHQCTEQCAKGCPNTKTLEYPWWPHTPTNTTITNHHAPTTPTHTHNRQHITVAKNTSQCQRGGGGTAKHQTIPQHSLVYPNHTKTNPTPKTPKDTCRNHKETNHHNTNTQQVCKRDRPNHKYKCNLGCGGGVKAHTQQTEPSPTTMHLSPQHR